MSFTSDIRAFALKVEQRQRDIFVGCATEVHRSVVEGSAVTGAPGQPVDTGALRASWNLRFESEHSALTSTNLVYAPIIEEGRGPHGPITIRSQVGGTNSVALTRAGWQATANHVTARVVR